MSANINKKYSEMLLEYGFSQRESAGHTVAYENELTREYLYLSSAKEENNRSLVIHPGYEYAIEELTKHPDVVFKAQKEKYFHDSSMLSYPKRQYDSDKNVGSHYGLEFILNNIGALDFLLVCISEKILRTVIDLDLDVFFANNPDM